MLLYWVYFIYRLGRAGEPLPYMPVVGGSFCARFGQASLIGCLIVINFKILIRIRLSGPKAMWGKLG